MVDLVGRSVSVHGEFDGRPRGHLLSVRGEFQWPPMGSLTCPPSPSRPQLRQVFCVTATPTETLAWVNSKTEVGAPPVVQTFTYCGVDSSIGELGCGTGTDWAHETNAWPVRGVVVLVTHVPVPTAESGPHVVQAMLVM